MSGPADSDGDRATYAGAGVDIDAGDDLVERIKPLAKLTMRPEVLGGIGGFASLVGLPARYKNPVLVSGTDGVGTKLAVAFLTGRHDTVGIDLVAMCVNDVAVTGAEPLFFLDYFATGKLSVNVAEKVIAGVAEGCRQAGCALVGGETAEMPGLYKAGEYDLAGFCVGVVEKDGTWNGAQIRPGDRVLGLLSSGLHSNGYSLTRHIVFERAKLALDADVPGGGGTWADVLMRPTRIYVRSLRALADSGVAVGGAAHITGGGLPGNAPRCLPDGVSIVLGGGSWPVPAVFRELARLGNVEEAEMLRTYNMGIGMIVVVRAADVARAKDVLAGAGETVFEIGDVVASPGREPEATVEGHL